MNESNYPVYSLADSAPSVRASFIRKTYAHLALALLAFAGVEWYLLQLNISYELTDKVLSLPYGWIGVLGAFMLVGWFARSFAHSQSKPKQYAGLLLYVVMQAIIFVPVMIMAMAYSGVGIIAEAAMMTGVLFAGLTATVFITRKDFSFLKSFLTMGGIIALGLIVIATLFEITLGTWFSLAMIVFAAGAILYDTSKVLNEYGEDQYVGASLELFASVALLLWYILRLLMTLRD